MESFVKNSGLPYIVDSDMDGVYFIQEGTKNEDEPVFFEVNETFKQLVDFEIIIAFIKAGNFFKLKPNSDKNDYAVIKMVRLVFDFMDEWGIELTVANLTRLNGDSDFPKGKVQELLSITYNYINNK